MDRPPGDGFIRDGLDIRILARRQRLVIWLVAGNLLTTMAMCSFPFWTTLAGRAAAIPLLIALNLLFYLVFIATWIGLILLMTALRTNKILVIIAAMVTLLPMVNLLVLVLENRKATRALQSAGLTVGFFGVKDEEVLRRMNPRLCRQCGYDLTANATGRCPECGTQLDALQTEQISALSRCLQA